MNKEFFFLIISASILLLSAIVICVAPIINNIQATNHNPSEWRKLNCEFFADKGKTKGISAHESNKLKKAKNICYRRKAMYGLENSVFVINIIFSFVCSNFILLYYLDVGKPFLKITGLIGMISGIIGFVLTLVYVCYSGYIFNNDVAFGILDYTNYITFSPNSIKLFKNGARCKRTDNIFISVYENDRGEDHEYIKYKDLGKKQYNYDFNYYEIYNKMDSNCKMSEISECKNIDSKNNDCDYIFQSPETEIINKYIYDRWLTALILALIITIGNIALLIFGALIFKENVEKTQSNSGQTRVRIPYRSIKNHKSIS